MPEQGSAADGPRKRRRTWRWLLIAAIPLTLYTIPAVFTTHPKACASCHDMKPYYQSWATSRHRAAASDCLFCHAGPGLMNRTVYRATLYKDIVAVLSAGRVNLFGATQVDDASCQQAGCHSLNRLESMSGELRIGHRLHATKAKLACVDCHRGAGHDKVGGRTSSATEAQCSGCHASKMKDCTYCHVGRVIPTR